MTLRISTVQICATPYFDRTYACRPFSQFVAEIFGCAIMGMTATVKEASTHSGIDPSPDQHDLPGLLPNPRLVLPRQIFQSGFVAVLTSFSAWIVSSAHEYYNGDSVDALFTVIVPGCTFFTMFRIGEDVALLINQSARLSDSTTQQIAAIVSYTFCVLEGLLWVVAVLAAVELVAWGNATHWVCAVLFAPVGMVCRVWVQGKLNRPGFPLGTLVCNSIACMLETIIVEFLGDTGVYLGFVEGFVTSLSTISSVIHEVVHEIDTIHKGRLRSGVCYLVVQVVAGTLLPLVVFWAAGRDCVA